MYIDLVCGWQRNDLRIISYSFYTNHVELKPSKRWQISKSMKFGNGTSSERWFSLFSFLFYYSKLSKNNLNGRSTIDWNSENGLKSRTDTIIREITNKFNLLIGIYKLEIWAMKVTSNLIQHSDKDTLKQNTRYFLLYFFCVKSLSQINVKLLQRSSIHGMIVERKLCRLIDNESIEKCIAIHYRAKK